MSTRKRQPIPNDDETSDIEDTNQSQKRLRKGDGAKAPDQILMSSKGRSQKGSECPTKSQLQHANTTDQSEPMFMNISFESESIGNGNVDNGIEITEDDTEILSACEDETDNVEIKTDPKVKKRNKFDWKIESEWNSLDEALDFLENEGFVCYDNKNLKCGQKFYFRCKLIPKERKTWCAIRRTLSLPSDSTKVIILQNQFEHNHEKLLEGVEKPTSDEMIEFIIDLFKCGTTKIPDVIRHINYAREKRNLFTNEKNPEKRQIEYQLRKYRNSEAPPMIKLGDMIGWCEQYNKFPTDIDEAFVLNIETSSPGENLSFHFAFSTPRLLELLSPAHTICIDATYKLNWLGFPLMVLGTVDRAKRFHPFAHACCSHEKKEDYKFVFQSIKDAIETHLKRNFQPKKLIADGADQIRNAFYEVFASAELDIMCFAHVIRNCRKRPFTSRNNKELALDDIRKIQSAPNRPSFNMMTKLFCEKWEQIETDFVTYFDKEWLGVHCNWYEGAADYTASTNNGQESHNAVIKRKVTLRRRLPMNQFLVCLRDMTADISKQFAEGERAIATEPVINRKVFEEAMLMGNNNFKAFKAKKSSDTKVIFSVPSTKCVDPTESYYKTLVKATWTSFDEFIVHGFQQFYIVKFSLDKWKTESTCTCTYFFKQHMCKHIVAIGIRLKIVDPLTSANPVLLAPTRRKAGRPRRTAKALNVQT